MKIAAFDLEIARILPEETRDLFAHAPLGITCAAVARSDGPTTVWQNSPQLTRDEARSLVHDLQGLVQEGYTLVSWNGCNFDFRVLAEESGLVAECGDLALAHVDLMLFVTFTKGYFLAFDKALKGARLAGKLPSVTLGDGRVITHVGANAPALWAQGETDAVLTYLRRDVEQLVKLAAAILAQCAIRWTSGTGTPQSVPVNKLLSVRDCFRLPKPDTSWMSSPPTRAQFVSWIPGVALS